MKVIELQAHQVPQLLQHRDVAILDMRDQLSFASGHLQGARPANDDNIGRLLTSAEHERPVLIYCDRGHSSLELANFLAGVGYREVFNLNGGWRAWERFVREV